MKKPSEELKGRVLDLIKKPLSEDARIVQPLSLNRNVFRIISLMLLAMIVYIMTYVPRESVESGLIPLTGVSLLLIGTYGTIYFLGRIKKSVEDVTTPKNRKSS